MEQGYEIKRGKNLAIKGKSQKRFIRFKSLGAGYTETDLKDILAEKSEQSPERKELTHCRNFTGRSELLPQAVLHFGQRKALPSVEWLRESRKLLVVR